MVLVLPGSAPRPGAHWQLSPGAWLLRAGELAADRAVGEGRVVDVDVVVLRAANNGLSRLDKQPEVYMKAAITYR